MDAAAKERPEEAPFAALRPHDYRLRTWNRTPAAKPTRPDQYNRLLSISEELHSQFDNLSTFLSDNNGGEAQ